MYLRTLGRTALLAALAAALGGPLQRGGAQPVLLKPRFEPGSTCYLELTQNIEQSMSGAVAGGAPIKTTFKQVFGVWQKVERVPDSDHLRVVMTFDRVCLETSGPMGVQSFDSDVDDRNDASNILAMAMGPMVGMSLTMELDKQDKIVSFSGMEAIRKRIEETTGGGPLYRAIRDELNDEAYRVMWGESRLLLYPRRKVKTGQTWTRTLEHHTGGVGSVISDYKCRLERLGTEDGRKVAVVSYTATVRQPAGKNPQPNQLGMIAKVEAGKFEGTAVYEFRRSQFVRQVSQGSIKVSMTAPQPSPQGGSVMLEQKIKAALSMLTEAQRQKQKRENRRQRRPGPNQ